MFSNNTPGCQWLLGLLSRVSRLNDSWRSQLYYYLSHIQLLSRRILLLLFSVRWADGLVDDAEYLTWGIWPQATCSMLGATASG